MEVELIEPHLGFDLFPPAAQALARSLPEEMLRGWRYESSRQTNPSEFS
jgi:hypothetical protein